MLSVFQRNLLCLSSGQKGKMVGKNESLIFRRPHGDSGFPVLRMFPTVGLFFTLKKDAAGALKVATKLMFK